jgi:hypothetical protein
MKTRPIWWQCSLEHEGCIPGHVCNSRERVRKLLTSIQTLHRKRYPSCPAELMRVAATKQGIAKGLGSITFKISAEAPASTLEGLQLEQPAVTA